MSDTVIIFLKSELYCIFMFYQYISLWSFNTKSKYLLRGTVVNTPQKHYIMHSDTKI